MKHAKTLFKWLMYAAVLVSFAYFLLAFKKHVEQLPPIAFNPKTVAVAILSIAAWCSPTSSAPTSGGC